MTPGDLRARIMVRRSDTFTLDIDLVIPAGITAALLGPSGAGKSTAVATLSGIIALDGGRIELAGTPWDDPDEDVFLPPEARAVGVVFQDHMLFPHLTVLENLAFGPRSRDRGRDDSHAIAQDWLERLGLEGLETSRPRDLSGGEAQRVALGRALATEPDLLLLDEPLSALDVTTRSELRRFLARHLRAVTGPRLLITHDPVEAFLLADVIHVIEAGRITQRGSADDIRLRPRTPYAAHLGGANLFTGIATAGEVDVSGHSLHIGDGKVTGPVLLTVRPAAVSLHLKRPSGSPRNTWQTTVELVEDLGERARLRTGPPLPLIAEVTTRSAREMKLAPGVVVWPAIKATDIGVEPAR